MKSILPLTDHLISCCIKVGKPLGQNFTFYTFILDCASCTNLLQDSAAPSTVSEFKSQRGEAMRALNKGIIGKEKGKNVFFLMQKTMQLIKVEEM